MWSTSRFLATWRTRLDPSFTGSGGSLPLQSIGADISSGDSGVSSLGFNKQDTDTISWFAWRQVANALFVDDSRGEVSHGRNLAWMWR